MCKFISNLLFASYTPERTGAALKLHQQNWRKKIVYFLRKKKRKPITVQFHSHKLENALGNGM
jgi:hypothetical protein